jgi:hypothetical protein
VVWAVVALGVGGPAALGATPRLAVAALALGLVFGAATASLWLLLALGLDLAAGHRPDRRRVAWTVATVAFTLCSPILVAAAGG